MLGFPTASVPPLSHPLVMPFHPIVLNFHEVARSWTPLRSQSDLTFPSLMPPANVWPNNLALASKPFSLAQPTSVDSLSLRGLSPVLLSPR